MAIFTVGTKAIIVAEKGNKAMGFEKGETVLITHNPIDGSRKRGRICFSRLDGSGRGYADPQNLLPVQEVKKGAEGVVEVQLEGAKFKGTVTDVLAVIKGLQELTNVAPATAKQFDKVDITTFADVKPVEVAVEAPIAEPFKLGTAVGIGTKIKITGNDYHGELHPHRFAIGEVVEVIGNVGDTKLGDVALRASDVLGEAWTVHEDDFEVYIKPEKDMLAYIANGKGQGDCLCGFDDGDLVKITFVESDLTEGRKAIHIRHTVSGTIGYADEADLELLF